MPEPLPSTGDAALLDVMLQAPRAFDADLLSKELAFEIAKTGALGPYEEGITRMAQEEVAGIHEEIRQIGIENATTDWKATRTHIPYARIPKKMFVAFERIYGHGCWTDKDFMEDTLRHHPELRIIVKRGIRGQEYCRGK